MKSDKRKPPSNANRSPLIEMVSLEGFCAVKRKCFVTVLAEAERQNANSLAQPTRNTVKGNSLHLKPRFPLFSTILPIMGDFVAILRAGPLDRARRIPVASAQLCCFFAIASISGGVARAANQLRRHLAAARKAAASVVDNGERPRAISYATVSPCTCTQTALGSKGLSGSGFNAAQQTPPLFAMRISAG